MLHKSFHFSAACGLVLLLAGSTQGRPPATTARLGANTGCITASFSGLQGHNGYLRITLFSKSSFPDGVPLARRDISLQALGSRTLVHPIEVTFTGLHPGAYAVCAFHDRNSSGKLAQNFLGIPQEEWGMSRNPHPQFRAPRFDEAVIGINPCEKRKILVILHQ